jgi:hypothetical protein
MPIWFSVEFEIVKNGNAVSISWKERVVLHNAAYRLSEGHLTNAIITNGVQCYHEARLKEKMKKYPIFGGFILVKEEDTFPEPVELDFANYDEGFRPFDSDDDPTEPVCFVELTEEEEGELEDEMIDEELKKQVVQHHTLTAFVLAKRQQDIN